MKTSGVSEQVGNVEGSFLGARRRHNRDAHLVAGSGGGDGTGGGGNEGDLARTGPGQHREGGVATTERKARLLGWVPLDLTPPPRAVETGAGAEAVAGAAAGVWVEAGMGMGVEPEVGVGVRAVTSDRCLSPGRSDGTDSFSSSPGRGVSKARVSQAGGTSARNAVVPEASVPKGSVVKEGVTEGGMPQVGCGRLWFHVPSARLVADVPEDWVAFAPVSGGILADVSYEKNRIAKLLTFRRHLSRLLDTRVVPFELGESTPSGRRVSAFGWLDM